MNLSKEINSRGTKDQIITYSVILTVLFFIFRSSIPVFKYPFILLFFCTLVYSLVLIKNRIILTLSDFFRNYYLIILTTIILICSFLLSKKIYLIIFKDSLNSIILVSSAFIMSVLINTRHGANSFYQGLVKSIVYFAVLISIDSLCKVLNIFTVNPIIDSDATLLVYKNIDYNFAILPVVLGMVGALYLTAKTKSFYSRIAYSFFLILFSIVIILSGSRRGVFVFILLVLTILIAQVPAFSKKKSFFKDLGLATRIYVLTSGLLSVVAYFIITGTSYEFKNKALKATGSKNILSSKITIASKLYKYYQRVNNNMLFVDFYDRFWSAEFNPSDPESGWGKRMHKIVFPLTGKNVEIIPDGVKGYLMDKTCNADTWDGNAFSFTVIKRGYEIKQNELVEASVYCYMSEDFNGSWARIVCGGKILGNFNGFDYNIKRKGTWQKLTCQVSNVDDIIQAVFYFSRNGTVNFSGLTGYIIFAYPEIKSVKTEYNALDPKTGAGSFRYKQVFPLAGSNVGIVPGGAKGYLIDSSINASSWNGNAYFYHNIGHNFTVNENEILKTSVFCYMSEDCDGSWARIDCKGQEAGSISSSEYNRKKKGTWQKLACNVDLLTDTILPVFYFSKSGTSSFSKLKGHIIFAYPQVVKVKRPFNPKYPGSGWGKRIHKTVFPLTGKNSEIVPSGARGYLMDNSTDADTRDGNSYSNTIIRRGFKINRNEKVDASVYCYMSEDFSGSWAKIICKGQKAGTFNGINYDTLAKGTWQKLTCEISQINDRVDINISFCKAESASFSDLKGYIIFAYPMVRKSVVNVHTDLKTLQEFDYLTPAKYFRAGLGESAFTFLPMLFQESEEKEFIRDLALRVISEDTTYFPYKSVFKPDSAKNDFIALRVTQWHFALKIFIKEYNWKQKIFGGGFSFLNWFSYYFTGDKTKYDYPHNPFLSVMLYSGIFGLIIYILLFYKVILYYIRYHKEYPVLIYFFLVAFFFSFFSGGSPLDPPIMGFFVILPFVFHYIHKKNYYTEEASVNENEKNSDYRS